jgi:uncharacterized Fe-S cluster-containing radical SAM superfamily protein
MSSCAFVDCVGCVLCCRGCCARFFMASLSTAAGWHQHSLRAQPLTSHSSTGGSARNNRRECQDATCTRTLGAT